MRHLWLLLILTVTPPLFAAPPPGHPSAEQAQQALGLTPQPLSHRGQVLEAIPSNSFVYLRVQDEQGNETWLAAPRDEVPVNSWIRYGKGRVMHNFYSRKHKRTFRAVTFVERIEKLGI